MLSLRANHAKQAAALSGMAQSFGYLLAAIGPILTGFLYDATHSTDPADPQLPPRQPLHVDGRTGCRSQCDGFPREIAAQEKNSHRHLLGGDGDCFHFFRERISPFVPNCYDASPLYSVTSFSRQN